MNDAGPRPPRARRAGLARFEKLRYRAYDAEMRRAGRRSAPPGSSVIVTKDLCRHHSWLDVAVGHRGRADCIQLREGRHRRGTARAARARRTLPHRRLAVAAVINDRPDIALLAGRRRRASGPGRYGGRRCAPGSRALPVGWGLDREHPAYHGVGPMFPSTTKQKDTIAGLEYLKKYLEYEPRLPPHLAIGGIGPGNIDLLAKAGARGVAVSSAVCESMHPGDVVRRLLGALTRAANGQGPKPDLDADA